MANIRKLYINIHRDIQSMGKYKGSFLRTGIVGGKYHKTKVLIVGQNPMSTNYGGKKHKYAIKRLSYNDYVEDWFKNAKYSRLLYRPVEFLNNAFNINIKLDNKEKQQYIQDSLAYYAYTNLIKNPSKGVISGHWLKDSIRIFVKECRLLKPNAVIVLGRKTEEIYRKHFAVMKSKAVFFPHPSRGHWTKDSHKKELCSKKRRFKQLILASH